MIQSAPARTKKEKLPMSQEKAFELIARAEKCGLHVEYDSGFLLVQCPAPADPQSPLAQMQQATIEGLCARLDEVFDSRLAAARGARGKDFIGAQLYLAESDTIGLLEGCDPNGVLSVRYRREIHERIQDARIIDTPSTVRAQQVIIIQAAGDDPLADRSPSRASMSFCNEKTRALLEQGEALGLRFVHSEGFVVALWPPLGDAEHALAERILLQLGRRVDEMLRLVSASARSKRGQDFIGCGIFPATAGAPGIVESCDSEGGGVFTYADEDTGSRRMLTFGREWVLIVAEEQPVSSSEPAPRRNWLRRTFGV
jgi:hypothetical protein